MVDYAGFGVLPALLDGGRWQVVLWATPEPEGLSTGFACGQGGLSIGQLVSGSGGQLADPVGAVHRFNPVGGLVVHGGRENTHAERLFLAFDCHGCNAVVLHKAAHFEERCNFLVMYYV